MPPPPSFPSVSSKRVWRLGTRKASVFPVPVWARATTSSPAKRGPSVAAWTGVIVSIPIPSMFDRNTAEIGRSAKAPRADAATGAVAAGMTGGESAAGGAASWLRGAMRGARAGPLASVASSLASSSALTPVVLRPRSRSAALSSGTVGPPSRPPARAM
eukprot:scaffold17261_cov106-Isochrysis_galbana.AAC.8